MAEKQDGKIRMRCTGCGKRVKFPKGVPGQAFRCPICHTMMVTPLGDQDAALPSQEKLKSLAPKRRTAARHPAKPQSVAAKPKPVEQAAPRAKQMTDTIERISEYQGRQAVHFGTLARRTLADKILSPEEQVAELHRLRHAKAVNLRRFVQTVLKELDQETQTLRDNPAAETQTIKEKLARLLEERREVVQYLKVMFELRTPEATAPHPAATPETPAAASAPPSRSSAPATQTSPGNAADPPSPGDKAPDSNGSPPS